MQKAMHMHGASDVRSFGGASVEKSPVFMRFVAEFHLLVHDPAPAALGPPKPRFYESNTRRRFGKTKDFHDAWERYLPASSIPVEFQPGMVSNGKPLPAGVLSPSSGASSGRISLIGAAPGGPEEPEE
jgi:hypothetical protein